ncbi:MAG: hypothetical protein J6H18_03800, partial [Lachnospiraceae bacterium]|nr:hypothetical protein [Lachnospiraceae bacterium]
MTQEKAQSPLPEEEMLPVIQIERLEEEIVEEEEAEGAKEESEESTSGRAWGIGILLAILILGGLAAAYFLWLKPATDYRFNMTRLSNGQYEEAIEGFLALGEYRDSARQADIARLEKALSELRQGQLEQSAASLAAIRDKSLDTSTYDAMAGSLLQKQLLLERSYEVALSSLEKLPKGRVRDLDQSFTAALVQSIDEKQYEAAARALADFTPYLSSTEGIRNLITEEMESLMNAGAYGDAAELSAQFGAVLEDPREDVRKRFRSFLREGEFYRAAALLEVFESRVGERTFYEKEAEEKLLSLLETREDEKAIELCFAFEHFRDMKPLLRLKTSEYLMNSARVRDWDRMNAILETYTPYNSQLPEEINQWFEETLEKEKFPEAEEALAQADSPQIDKLAWQYQLAQAYLEGGDPEMAQKHFAQLGEYKNSPKMLQEAIYRRVLKLWDEGRDEEADALLEELGTADIKEELRQEIILRSVRKMMEKEEPAPKELIEAYSLLYSIRQHNGVSEEINRLLEKWADIILVNRERKAYLDAMSSMGFVDTPNRVHICGYLMEKTPLMAGHREDGASWVMQDAWLPYNVFRFMELVSDGSGPAGSFIRFAMSMVRPNVPFDVTDIWNLWELRSDVRDLCSGNNHLLLFLSGVWQTADQKVSLSVTRNNKVFTVSYLTPSMKVDAGISAERFGLITAGGRLCDIRIIDYKTIELTNLSDGSVYRLIRL